MKEEEKAILAVPKVIICLVSGTHIPLVAESADAVYRELRPPLMKQTETNMGGKWHKGIRAKLSG